MRNVEPSAPSAALCLVLISACVDLYKVKRGVHVETFISIKGGGRPTRLLPHAKMLISFFLCWVDYALEGFTF